MKKTYTIDRRTWDRGRTGSLLLGPDEKQCCLGFICEQAGVERSLLQQVPLPNMILRKATKLSEEAAWCLGLLTRRDPSAVTLLTYSDLTDRAVTINDAKDISDEMREAKLKELFAPYDIELVFIN